MPFAGYWSFSSYPPLERSGQGQLLFLGSLSALGLLLLLLLWLQCGPVYVPDEDALQDEDEKYDDEDGE